MKGGFTILANQKRQYLPYEDESADQKQTQETEHLANMKQSPPMTLQ